MNINIIIKNQNSKVIDSVDINSIKTITGEFTRETIEMCIRDRYWSTTNTHL